MKDNPTMDNGAHFYRCDFQVHSPRDRQWNGDKAITDSERRIYAEEFVVSCRQKGLNAVAITDHHDMAFIPFIRDAANNEVDSEGNPVQQHLVVFPGMELTLGIPCQALLIFDADFPQDLFDLALNALAIKQSAPSDSQTVEVTRLGGVTQLAHVHEQLDRHEYLKGRYILLPNVSEGGRSTLLRSGHAGHYKEMPCVGGYLDGAVLQLGRGNQSIVAGKDSQYGSKKIGLFQTSDNRRRDFSELGKHSTWVKWAKPSAEALRQACLAQESRIAQEDPALPFIVITSISVSNSKFLGPISLQFNSQYNAIIGGRGTGKSTLLEYLRWALCDSAADIWDEMENDPYAERQKKLIDKTLYSLDANVQVNFLVNGVPHTVRRHSKSREIMLKIGQEEFEECTESHIRNILPIQAYGQKQLSNVGVRLDELQRFIRVPIRQPLIDLTREFKDTAAIIRSDYDKLQRKRTAEREVEEGEKELISLSEQANELRSSLVNLDEDDRAIIDQQSLYEEEEQIVAVWKADIERLQKSLKNLSETLLSIPTPLRLADSEIVNSEVIKCLHSTLQSSISEITQAISDQEKQLAKILTSGGQYSQLQAQWDALRVTFRQRYELAKQKSASQASTLAVLSDIESRIKELRQRMNTLKAEIKQLNDIDTTYNASRQKWQTLHRQRALLFDQQCNALTNLSGGMIRAKLKECAGIEGISEKLKTITTGTNVRTNKIQDLCTHIATSADALNTWLIVVSEMELLARFQPSVHTAQALPATPTLSKVGFVENDLQKIAGKLTPESWLELSLVILEDQPEFEYKAREGEYIPFADASAGQQATALLWALLNQEGPPLIIDQPEDDLDNQVIQDVVGQIWAAKKRRQLIFSSHNANLVVNGDAELVVCFNYRVAGEQSNGLVEHEGAIDMPEICDAITMVMEGGKQAFKLRMDKYGF